MNLFFTIITKPIVLAVLIGIMLLNIGGYLMLLHFNVVDLWYFLLYISIVVLLFLFTYIFINTIRHDLIDYENELNISSIILLTILIALGKGVMTFMTIIRGPMTFTSSITCYLFLLICISLIYYYKYGRLFTLYEFVLSSLKGLPYAFIIQLILLFIIYTIQPELLFAGMDNMIMFLNENALVMQALDSKLMLIGFAKYFTVEQFLSKVNYDSTIHNALFKAYISTTEFKPLRSPLEHVAYMEGFKKSFLLENGSYSKIVWHVINNGGGFRPKL